MVTAQFTRKRQFCQNIPWIVIKNNSRIDLCVFTETVDLHCPPTVTIRIPTITADLIRKWSQELNRPTQLHLKVGGSAPERPIITQKDY